MPISPPRYAQAVLHGLERAGYQAHFVGGCVRDMLLQRRPQDWDVCTDALPEAVLRVFPRAEPTGLRHGTVSVRLEGRRVEVTTFRTDGVYLDHRRPEQVRFVTDLERDLERRDFTMNAIALSLSGVMTDPFGGQADIAAGRIRCVGDALLRFEEDALRMLRALRFSAKLGFSVEENTMQAICASAPLAAALAPERVRDELEKILISVRPELLGIALRCGLLERYVLRRDAPAQLRRLAALPRTRQARWAGLCALLMREGLIEDTSLFLQVLRLDGNTMRSCAAGTAAALEAPPADAADWKRLLARSGTDAAICTAAAMDALRPSGAARALRDVCKSGECFSLRQLAVDGSDLLSLGLRGEAVGDALRRLLEHVIEHPGDNRKERLLELL